MTRTNHITITRMNDELLARGMRIVKGLAYDMQRMTARYLIQLTDGRQVEMTLSEVAQLIK